LSRVGRTSEALVEAERARQLDPVSSQTQAFFGFILYQARHFDRAIEECNKAIELDASNPGARWFLALALERRNRTAEAIEQLKRSVEDSHRGAVFVSALGHAYGLAGQRADALADLKELKDRSQKSYISAFDIAMVYVGLDDREAALQWLQRAYDERAMRLEQVTEPSFDLLRSDTRFRSLVRRIGLPVR
jgi:tetratricopeptide (TPR) repeat protein